MAELYLRGALTHMGNRVEFLYPGGVRWRCNRCGRCCRDAEGHERRVLLLDRDIERIEDSGAEGFYEATGESPFTGIMLKRGGACVFLTPQGCGIYEDRALLCRTYPFWVERKGETFIIKTDEQCPGLGGGPELDEKFYCDLLTYALAEMDH
jgi:Fe-S-cluster containining protein